MDSQMIANRAQDIAEAVKSGSCSSLSDELNSMSEADRLAICRQADEINHKMRTGDSSLPDLHLDIECVNGTLMLKDMRVVNSSGRELDIYDRPSDRVAQLIDPLPAVRDREPGNSKSVLPGAQPSRPTEAARQADPIDTIEPAPTTTPVPGARVSVEQTPGNSKVSSGSNEKPPIEKSGEVSRPVELGDCKSDPEIEQIERLATKIAKLVLEKGDFYTEYKRAQVEKAFDELTLAGAGKLDKLIEKINDELKKHDSSLRLRSSSWTEPVIYQPLFQGSSSPLVDISPRTVNEPRSCVEIVNATDGEVADQIVSTPHKGIAPSDYGVARLTWVRPIKLGE
jgi:hypothetical protein